MSIPPILKSRKFYAALIALLLIFLGERAGITAEQLTQAVNVLVAFVIGQGLADIRAAK